MALKNLLFAMAIISLVASVIVPQKKPFIYRAKPAEPFSCLSARDHQHDDVVELTVYVVSWDGCELKGVIRGGKFNGRIYTLFGGFEGSLKPQVQHKITVRYDRSCGQVLFAIFPDDFQIVTPSRKAVESSDQLIAAEPAPTPIVPQRPGLNAVAFAGDRLALMSGEVYTVPASMLIVIERHAAAEKPGEQWKRCGTRLSPPCQVDHLQADGTLERWHYGSCDRKVPDTDPLSVLHFKYVPDPTCTVARLRFK